MSHHKESVVLVFLGLSTQQSRTNFAFQWPFVPVLVHSICVIASNEKIVLVKEATEVLSEHASVGLTSLYLYGHLISWKPYGSFGERGLYTHLSGDAPRNGWVSLTRNPLFETVTPPLPFFL